MSYIITTVTLQNVHGEEEEYEVGADVEYEPEDRECGWMSRYVVGEPDISAPGSTLKESRLAVDPQAPGWFPVGWSDICEDALTEAYKAAEGASFDDTDPDECDDTDIYDDRDYTNYIDEES